MENPARNGRHATQQTTKKQKEDPRSKVFGLRPLYFELVLGSHFQSTELKATKHKTQS
jgi:hypothetical protein